MFYEQIHSMEYASTLAEKFQFIMSYLFTSYVCCSIFFKENKCIHTILNTFGGYRVHKKCRWSINIPISELAATKTFPPPSIKLVIAATSSDPPNSTYEKTQQHSNLIFKTMGKCRSNIFSTSYFKI